MALKETDEGEMDHSVKVRLKKMKFIERFWKKVGRYIRKYYDTGMIERIYVCGDGASWIRAATEYIPESVFVIDKFHLTKYINHAAGQMLDEKDLCKSEIYRIHYEKRLLGCLCACA